MKTLSLRPPWAWAVLHLGKKIENRTWQTHYRGPVLIHAGKKITTGELDALARHCKRLGVTPPEKDELPVGGIVAKAILANVVERIRDPFYVTGNYAWVLDNVKPVRFFACNGRLGLYETAWPIKSR